MKKRIWFEMLPTIGVDHLGLGRQPKSFGDENTVTQIEDTLDQEGKQRGGNRAF